MIEPRGEWDDPLMDAAEAGDVATVRWLLENGADPNALPHFLLWLIRNGDEALLDEAVRRGANPNVVPADNLSALECAVVDGDVEMVRRLVALGATCNEQLARCPSDTTSLHEAARDGNVEMVEVLIASGCERVINAFDYIGMAPIHAAMEGPREQRPAIVARLLDAGADPNAIDPNMGSRLPLATAIEHGDMELVDLLLARGADPDAPDDWGVTPRRRLLQESCGAEWNDLRRRIGSPIPPHADVTVTGRLRKPADPDKRPRRPSKRQGTSRRRPPSR